MDAQEPQPRKLIVCGDGTWNSRDAPGAATTNVAKMARSLRAFDDIGVSQLIYYHPGAGTGNGVDQFLGGAFGVGLSGNVQSEYAFLPTTSTMAIRSSCSGFPAAPIRCVALPV